MARFSNSRSKSKYGLVNVEYAFIDHYMSKARGDYVKIYLAGLSAEAKGEDISDELIAEALEMDKSTVANAWKYWESQGLIAIENDSIRYLSCADVLYSDTATVPKKVQLSNNTNKGIIEIEKILGRPLNNTETDSYYEWLSEYDLTEEAVLCIVDDAVKRDKKNFKYFEGMCVNMSSEGVHSLEDAKLYFESRDEQNKTYKTILDYLGIHRQPSVPEKALINRWTNEYNFNIDKILEACDLTVSSNNPSIKYVDTILTNWFNGVETVTQRPSGKGKGVVNTGSKLSDEELRKLLFGDN